LVRGSPKEFNSLLSMTSSSEQIPELLLAAMPRGWFDLETVNYYRLLDNYLAPEAFNAHQINPARLHQAQTNIELATAHSSGALLWRHHLFARLLIPNVEGAIRKAAFAQQGVEAAIIACALERYRRSHQHYPDKLDLLVPDFVRNLSTDIISGQPLHYRQIDTEHYLLYSIGWNEIDDGGKLIWGNTNAGSSGRSEGGVVPLDGDWVWAE
jgi:hypothetical protein